MVEISRMEQNAKATFAKAYAKTYSLKKVKKRKTQWSHYFPLKNTSQGPQPSSRVTQPLLHHHPTLIQGLEPILQGPPPIYKLEWMVPSVLCF